jgi:hypothetical protein
MRESRTSGSGRGDQGNLVPYRHRISPIAVRPGEGLLTDHIGGARLWRWERVFVPRTGPCLGLGSIKSNKKAGVRFAIRRDCFT